MAKSTKRNLLRSAKVVVGLIVVALILVFVILTPMVDHTSATDLSADVMQGPSSAHWLGTTATGEDVFAQLAIGGRVSLLVGALSGAIATLFAVLVGVIGGYTRGKVDGALVILTTIFLVLPGLPLLIVIAGYLPSKGLVSVAVVIAVTSWATGARSVRAQTLSLRTCDYVLAARVNGETRFRIIVLEIVINEITLIATTFLFTVIAGVLTEAGLAFLGLESLTTVSWGTMLYFAQNQQALLLGAWWWFVPPGLLIALFGMGLSLINFGVDEYANPRLLQSLAPIAKRRRARTSSAVTELTESRPTTLPGPPDDMPDAILNVNGLCVSYQFGDDAVPAVADASFTLRKGHLLGLAGESGSGKSTLTNAISRLLRPPGRVVSGRVDYNLRGTWTNVLELGDRELQQFRWSELSMVFQSAMSSLNPVMRVQSQFDDVIRAHRRDLSRSDRRDRCAELLSRVSLPADTMYKYPHELSGGMRQRVAIAMALSLTPSVIILDEPTTALDVLVQREIIDQIIELQATDRFAVIFTTHDLALLMETCDSVAVMRHGKIVELGPVEQVRVAPQHDYTAQLLESMREMAVNR